MPFHNAVRSQAVAEFIPDTGDPHEVALLEVRADHVGKAGRDLFFLGLVVAASGFFVAPEPWKHWMLLGIPSGLFLHLVALYGAARLRRRAMARR
jgi:hypothetical protein